MRVEEVGASIAEVFIIDVDTARLDGQLEELEGNNRVIKSAVRAYKITEEQTSSLEAEINAAQDVETRVREQFVEQVSSVCPEIDPGECWDEFNQRCLVPLVLEMGARTYDFLSEGSRPRELSFEDTDFFAKYGSDDGDALRRKVVDFITPEDPLVRDFMLRTLDAALFLEARGLRKEVLEKLSATTGGQRSLTLFLDTNLLFSVLDLHDNPSNQSVNALLKLIDEITPRVKCKLYVLPITIEEFRRTILANRDELKRVSLTGNVAEAVKASGRLSGVKMKYVEACQSSGRAISPETFFGPYVSNPVAVIRNRGVELYNDNLEKYKTLQDVVDDVNEIWESTDALNKTDGRYRAIEHDMLLLHFVEDGRPSSDASPLETESWVVTIDYGLLRFDRGRNDDLPICIHPSYLVQMLQFWLPRTETFEAAMVESLRIPFLFRRFDTASEKATLRILEVLSRYEVGDLSTDVITHLLLDDALGAAIGRTEDEDAEAAIVKERLSAPDTDLRFKLDDAMGETEELRSVTAQQSSQIGELERNVRQGDVTVEELQQELKHADKSLSEGIQNLSELQARLSKSETEIAASKLMLDYLVKWVFVPTALAFLLVTGTGLLASANNLASPLAATAAVAVVSIVAVLWVVESQGRKLVVVRRMAWYTILRKWRKWAYGALGTIALSLVSRFIWEYAGPMF